MKHSLLRSLPSSPSFLCFQRDRSAFTHALTLWPHTEAGNAGWVENLGAEITFWSLRKWDFS